jgi:hypothetical protein
MVCVQRNFFYDFKVTYSGKRLAFGGTKWDFPFGLAKGFSSQRNESGFKIFDIMFRSFRHNNALVYVRPAIPL